MKILFTGSSSFTGFWFIQELIKRDHEVYATFQKPIESYFGVRKKRIEKLLPNCQSRFSCSFGSTEFIELIESQHFDLYCHHSAFVNDYKNPDFPVIDALKANTLNLKNTLFQLKKSGCKRILLTSSVFEQYEGNGSDEAFAVSPYGLSKGLTTEIFKFETKLLKLNLGRFVIPNPFGPYEKENSLTSLLIKHWVQGKPFHIHSPNYVRDNIHVSLLASAYADCAHTIATKKSYESFCPSGYRETQGAFCKRFSNEMKLRLNIPCHYSLAEQQTFIEPKIRINDTCLDSEKLGWSEENAWNELSDYYRQTYVAQ